MLSTDQTNEDEAYSINTLLKNVASIQPQIIGIHIIGNNGTVFSSIPFKSQKEILAKRKYLTSDDSHYSDLYRENSDKQSSDIISYFNDIKRYGEKIGVSYY